MFYWAEMRTSSAQYLHIDDRSSYQRNAVSLFPTRHYPPRYSWQQDVISRPYKVSEMILSYFADAGQTQLCMLRVRNCLQHTLLFWLRHAMPASGTNQLCCYLNSVYYSRGPSTVSTSPVATEFGRYLPSTSHPQHPQQPTRLSQHVLDTTKQEPPIRRWRRTHRQRSPAKPREHQQYEDQM